MQKRASSQNPKQGKKEFEETVFTMLEGKMSEMQWFVFETKIRQVITELTTPILDSQSNLKEKWTEQLNEYVAIKRRIEELEFIF